MHLDEAKAIIRQTLSKMNEGYGRPVFDEWAIVDLSRIQGHIYDYSGPRHADFQKSLHDNLIPLREEMREQDLESGDFSFVRHAGGTDFDAFVILKKDLYVLLNHTTRTMEEITRDPAWIKAQRPFVRMSEAFRVNPVELP